MDEGPFRIRYNIGKKKDWWYPNPSTIHGRKIVEHVTGYELARDFATYKAKARGAEHVGMLYALMWTSLDGEFMRRLPDDWYKWGPDKLHAFNLFSGYHHKPIRLLGLDPGSRNTGYTVLEADGWGKMKILERGMLKCMLTDLTSPFLAGEAQAFIDEVSAVGIRHKVTHVIAERYQTRSIRGPQIELVSMMNGIVAAASRYWSTKPIIAVLPAAQWKNMVNDHVIDLESLYQRKGVVPHEIDSTCITIYGLSLFAGVKPFRANVEAIRKFIDGAARATVN